MKKAKNKLQRSGLLCLLIVAAGMLSSFNKGIEDDKKNESTINITGTRFLFPLIERWGQEFKKIHPEVNIVVKQGVANPDINASAAPIKNKNPEKGKYVTVSRFAIVPIVNAHNPTLAKLHKTGFSEKDFASIYFKKGKSEDNLSAFNNQTSGYRVYSRTACTSATFSSVFGEEIKNLKNSGSPIENDNLLLETIIKDTLGVAYNDLGIVYDLKTRQQKKGISVVPSDLNGNGQIEQSENFYTNLDELIRNLESTTSNLPPRGDFTLIYQEKRPEVNAFVQWILTDGQKYIHEYGFLNK